MHQHAVIGIIIDSWQHRGLYDDDDDEEVYLLVLYIQKYWLRSTDNNNI